MRIRVVHETHYAYEQPARGLIQLMRLTPRDHDGQHVREWRIEPSVDGRLTKREDGFGNLVHWFTADAPAEALTVRVSGEVETFETHGIIRGSVERLPEPFYLRETNLSVASDAIQEFAESVSSSGDQAILAVLHRLLDRINEHVEFTPGPASAATTATEAFATAKGVCQDMTHIFIAAARHLEIPTRYVSGYFRRADGVDEQDAAHAWAEALVPVIGWVGFDPANGISTSEAHLRVATGLDYLGAAPIRGSRVGGGIETLTVNLRVDEANQSQSQRQS